MNDQHWEAQVDETGKYTARIQVEQGTNEIIALASKEGLTENELIQIIQVDDQMAALELNEYPYGQMIRDELMVSGKTTPGAQITLRLDENEPMTITVDETGAFSQKIEAEDWVEHTIEITASQEGKADCTAIFSFTSVYEDASKGIAAYRKTLTEGLSAPKISRDPGAHIGERIKLEVYTQEVERTDGRLILKGIINQKKDMPIILVCDSYLEDEILEKMILTVYGEVIEPSLTETPIPRLDVEYISYLKKIYHK